MDIRSQPYDRYRRKGYHVERMEITEAIQKGLLNNLPILDPFNDIDPIINLNTKEPNLEALANPINEDFELLGVRKNKSNK